MIEELASFLELETLLLIFKTNIRLLENSRLLAPRRLSSREWKKTCAEHVVFWDWDRVEQVHLEI